MGTGSPPDSADDISRNGHNRLWHAGTLPGPTEANVVPAMDYRRLPIGASRHANASHHWYIDMYTVPMYR